MNKKSWKAYNDPNQTQLNPNDNRFYRKYQAAREEAAIALPPGPKGPTNQDENKNHSR